MELYKGSVFEDIFALKPFVVGGTVFGLVAIGYLVGLLDFILNEEHNGRHGVTWFWTTTFGDPIILPVTAGLITWFYQKARVEETAWISSPWLSWLLFAFALIITIWFISTRATLEYEKIGGDWTTTPDGGINTYGFAHGVFFWLISFVWLEFSVKAAWYIYKEGFSGETAPIVILTVFFIIIFLVVLGPRDNDEASPLYNLLRRYNWHF